MASEYRLPVRVAVLGAGIFASDAYVPVLKDITDVLLPRYIWSRSQESAEKLASRIRDWAPDVEAVWGEAGLTRLEGDAQVPCCAIVLPIQQQPAMVKRMLQAGKHVLQEKPLAVSQETALDLVAWYHAWLAPGPAAAGAGADPPGWSHAPKPFWGVAENFRLEPVFAKASEYVQALGPLLSASVAIEVAMAPSNKYYSCEWRREPSLQGGFIADCGVHYIAGLREMVRRRVESVCSLSSHMNAGLPPPDSITAIFTLAPEEVPGPDGSSNSSSSSVGATCSGTLHISFCAPVNKMLWRAVCEGGVVEVTRGTWQGKFGYLVTVTNPGAAATTEFCDFGGIDAELRAFAHEVASRGSSTEDNASDNSPLHKRNRRLISPLEALEDLAVIDACLKSGLNHGAPTRVDRTAMVEFTS